MLEHCFPKASFLLKKNANLLCGACSSSVFLLEIFKWAISTQNNFDNKRILLTLKTIHVYFEARSTVNVIIAPASVLLFTPFLRCEFLLFREKKSMFFAVFSYLVNIYFFIFLRFQSSYFFKVYFPKNDKVNSYPLKVYLLI